MLLFNRGASTSGAPASDSGTSRSTSSDSDDSDVDYSRWDVDADTQDFYDDHGFELEAQHLYETRRTSVD
jgi:activator of HSP90 ATPase